MDVFLHTVIIIDIGANLGANAKAAVKKKQRQTGLLAEKELKEKYPE